MIQLGGESFHDRLLARWHKRHNVRQLETVLDAMDRTRQDYTVFQMLSDYETTAEELLDGLRLLILAALRRPRMRIASTAYTIPLYDADTRKSLEFSGRLGPGRVRHWTDYLRPQPGWMDPLVAELADLADARLAWALNLEDRGAALYEAFEAVLERLREEAGRGSAARRNHCPARPGRGGDERGPRGNAEVGVKRGSRSETRKSERGTRN